MSHRHGADADSAGDRADHLLLEREGRAAVLSWLSPPGSGGHVCEQAHTILTRWRHAANTTADRIPGVVPDNVTIALLATSDTLLPTSAMIWPDGSHTKTLLLYSGRPADTAEGLGNLEDALTDLRGVIDAAACELMKAGLSIDPASGQARAAVAQLLLLPIDLNTSAQQIADRLIILPTTHTTADWRTITSSSITSQRERNALNRIAARRVARIERPKPATHARASRGKTPEIDRGWAAVRAEYPPAQLTPQQFVNYWGTGQEPERIFRAAAGWDGHDAPPDIRALHERDLKARAQNK